MLTKMRKIAYFSLSFAFSMIFLIHSLLGYISQNIFVVVFGIELSLAIILLLFSVGIFFSSSFSRILDKSSNYVLMKRKNILIAGIGILGVFILFQLLEYVSESGSHFLRSLIFPFGFLFYIEKNSILIQSIVLFVGIPVFCCYILILYQKWILGVENQKNSLDNNQTSENQIIYQPIDKKRVIDNYKLISCLFFLISFLVRFFIFVGAFPGADTPVYLEDLEMFRKFGFSYFHSTFSSIIQGPLFLFLTSCSALFNNNLWLTIQIVIPLLGSGIIILFMRVIRILTRDEKIAALAGLILLFSIPQIRFGIDVYKNIFHFFLFLIAINLFLREKGTEGGKKPAKPKILLGILFLFVSLTYPLIFFLCLIVLVIVFLWPEALISLQTESQTKSNVFLQKISKIHWGLRMTVLFVISLSIATVILIFSQDSFQGLEDIQIFFFLVDANFESLLTFNYIHLFSIWEWFSPLIFSGILALPVLFSKKLNELVTDSLGANLLKICLVVSLSLTFLGFTGLDFLNNRWIYYADFPLSFFGAYGCESLIKFLKNARVKVSTSKFAFSEKVTGFLPLYLILSGSAFSYFVLLPYFRDGHLTVQEEKGLAFLENYIGENEFSSDDAGNYLVVGNPHLFYWLQYRFGKNVTAINMTLTEYCGDPIPFHEYSHIWLLFSKIQARFHEEILISSIEDSNQILVDEFGFNSQKIYENDVITLIQLGAPPISAQFVEKCDISSQTSSYIDQIQEAMLFYSIL